MFIHDLHTLSALLLRRRRVLLGLAGAALAPLLGCEGSDSAGTGGSGGSGPGSATSTTTTGGASCATIPQETEGPYPGDGTNGANALALSGIVRSDITTSLAGATGVAEGVPLIVQLTVVNANGACAPLSGHAIYLWHCDAAGNYSMYSPAAADENYLRGVQETDADGAVTFTTIFPGCYSGRWPHIHFEVYSSLAEATNGSNKVAVSQLALPEAACDEAYTAAGYSVSVANLAAVSLETDGIFKDGYSLELAEVTGSVAEGFTATLTIAIDA